MTIKTSKKLNTLFKLSQLDQIRFLEFGIITKSCETFSSFMVRKELGREKFRKRLDKKLRSSSAVALAGFSVRPWERFVVHNVPCG